MTGKSETQIGLVVRPDRSQPRQSCPRRAYFIGAAKLFFMPTQMSN